MRTTKIFLSPPRTRKKMWNWNSFSHFNADKANRPFIMSCSGWDLNASDFIVKFFSTRHIVVRVEINISFPALLRFSEFFISSESMNSSITSKNYETSSVFVI